MRISPWKGVIRFGKKGKLSPRYIGPYEILDKVGSVEYRLALPPELEDSRCLPCVMLEEICAGRIPHS